MPRGSSRAWSQQLLPPRHIGALGSGPVGHQGLQQPHRVGTLAVADGLDVGVRRRMNRRRDRHPVGQVQIRRNLQRRGTDDRLGVGAGQHTQSLRKAGQPARIPHLEQQMLRPPGARGQDQVCGGVGTPVPAQPTAGANGANLPQPVGALLEAFHRRHRNDLRASGFREAQVVLHQGVLGTVAAPRHAAPAFQAAGALRPRTAKVRVGHRLSGCFGAIRAEEHPDRGGHPGVAAPHVVGDLLDDAVGVGERRVLHHAQHPLRLLVVRHQLAAPVGDVRPLLVFEERLRWHVQGVGVVQRTAADPSAGQDHHVAQRVDALDAIATELRRPQELAQVPGGLGELLVGEAAAGLQHAHAVALFRQPQRADAAPESRTDDQDVVIRLHRCSIWRPQPPTVRPTF